jgi:hypothetical protein
VLGQLIANSIVSELGAILTATGIVSAFVDKVLHKQLENMIDEKLSDVLRDFTLRDRLNGAGVTNVVTSRIDYHGRRIDTFVSSANLNLIMTGTALRTGIRFEKIQDTFKAMVERGVSVTVCLINPDNINVISTLSKALDEPPEQLAKDIKASLLTLSKTRDTLSEPQKKNFLLKVHDAIPFASGILIDTLQPSKHGIIQVEIKPYKSGLSDSLAIEVRGSNDYIDNNVLYKTFRESWMKIVADSSDYQAPVIP